jgi:hypothetical protein
VKPSGKHKVVEPNVETLTVELGDRSYAIVIGSLVLDELGARLASELGTGSAAVLTNPTVGGLYLAPVESSLRRAGFEVVHVEIPDGEEYKSLDSLARIYDRLLAAAGLVLLNHLDHVGGRVGIEPVIESVEDGLRPGNHFRVFAGERPAERRLRGRSRLAEELDGAFADAEVFDAQIQDRLLDVRGRRFGGGAVFLPGQEERH